MSTKKIVVAVLLILVLIGGFVAGLYLIQQRQEVREQAAVPEGDAEVFLFPESGNFDVGETFPVTVSFNTANIPINGISVRLVYPYSGATPEITASNIEIDQSLLASGDWTCPVREINEEGGEVSIEIACATIEAGGFSTSTQIQLATLDLTVNREPQTDPTVVRFDSAQSRITAEATGEDILLIPQSEGTYQIASAGPVATVTVEPTPTGAEEPTLTPTEAPVGGTEPTNTPTLTPTSTMTPTTAPTSTATATPTLMDSGISLPTYAGIFLAMLVIFGSLVLAL